MADELERCEEQIQKLETEKRDRNKETVQNLEDLLEELTYIEKINEDLSSQVEKANKQKNNAIEQLEAATAMVDKLSARVSSLENDQRASFKNTWPSQMLTGILKLNFQLKVQILN